MEVLERIGELLGTLFGGLARAVERGLTSLFGSANARYLKRLQARVQQINALEEKYMAMTDADLRGQTELFRERLRKGETLDDLLVEAFAVCREAGRRWLGMRHYDVQLVGGMVLHHGAIAEMVTGEGKTLVATLPAYLNALEGKGVHVVTVNDYLARRDMEWMGPLYLGLGLTVGAIYADMPYEERLRAYDCDITYGTNNEFGFDYLRDNMKPAARGDRRFPPRWWQCQRALNFAVIDEVDNILIDEARTPLIISGPAHDDVAKYALADRIARQLQKDVHFEVKEKEHTCHLTDEGVRHAEKLAGVESFYTPGNMEWPHLLDNALKAHYLYRRDVNYVVENDEIIIVDEFTGRKMPGRQWSDGLHQAVEAKEGVRIKEETQTMATITLQNFFKLYKKIAGMTGTAMTEANEFWKIYKLEVVAIPTNRPLKRINYPDVIYKTEREKYEAIAEEIERMHKWDVVELTNGTEIWGKISRQDDERVEIVPKDKGSRQTIERGQIRAISRAGRPILVGTVSIEKSERLSLLLDRCGIKHQVLNAKHHKREAEIIAQAGRKGAVTIATNMAGRGTDIILGGNPETMAWAILQNKYATRLDVPKDEWNALVQEIQTREKMKEEGREVASMGGLHVLGTERHESRRIDNQLRGRCGRQGDPGSSRFYLSLEDDLMRIFAGEWVKNMLTRLGMKDGESIESRMVSRRIEGAQKKVEEMHFERRKHLLEYDEVMDEQRKRVYGLRQKILTGAVGKDYILELIDKQIDETIEQCMDPNYGSATFAVWAAGRLGIELPDAKEFRDMDFPAADAYSKELAEQALHNQLQDIIEDNLSEEEDPESWNWEAVARIVNTRWQLNVTVRELKKIGRDGLFDFFFEKAVEAIQRVDLKDGEKYLAPDYGLRTVCSWAKYKFGVDLDIEQARKLERDELRELLRQQVLAAYTRKEAELAVMTGVARSTHGEGPNGRVDRDALARWAHERLELDLSADDLKSRQRDEVLALLMHASQQHQQKALAVLQEGLAQVDSLFRGHPEGVTARKAANGNGALDSMARWFSQTLQLDVPPDALGQLTHEELRLQVSHAVDDRFHPEMRNLEQRILLELLDDAWKDHLLAMDHLKNSIGMRGYAQVDPKVEYKREGMRLFNAMWKSIGDQATERLFHVTQMNDSFVSSTWSNARAIHESAPGTSEIVMQQQSAISASENPERKLEPIRNRFERVGRNDPCPCGSGKKFKNCHMRQGGMP